MSSNIAPDYKCPTSVATLRVGTAQFDQSASERPIGLSSGAGLTVALLLSLGLWAGIWLAFSSLASALF